MVPSSICSRWMARQVWKPLEWAEMPRMACIDTGRPRIVSWRRPAQSVHGDRQLDRLLERDMGQLGGDAADRVGGNAAALRDRVGRIALVEIALGDQLEDRHAACGRRPA